MVIPQGFLSEAYFSSSSHLNNSGPNSSSFFFFPSQMLGVMYHTYRRLIFFGFCHMFYSFTGGSIIDIKFPFFSSFLVVLSEVVGK